MKVVPKEMSLRLKNWIAKIQEYWRKWKLEVRWESALPCYPRGGTKMCSKVEAFLAESVLTDTNLMAPWVAR